jgi:hypothetical protein
MPIIIMSLPKDRLVMAIIIIILHQYYHLLQSYGFHHQTFSTAKQFPSFHCRRPKYFLDIIQREEPFDFRSKGTNWPLPLMLFSKCTLSQPFFVKSRIKNVWNRISVDPCIESKFRSLYLNLSFPCIKLPFNTKVFISQNS